MTGKPTSNLEYAGIFIHTFQAIFNFMLNENNTNNGIMR